MGIFPSEYEGRQHGLMRSRSTMVTFYISKTPGPSEEKSSSQMVSDSLLDHEFERGGPDAVATAIDRFLDPIFRQLRNELLRPYREAAKRPRGEAFGPLGVFMEMGRLDIIQKIALDGHEKRKASEGEVRDERQDGV